MTHQTALRSLDEFVSSPRQRGGPALLAGYVASLTATRVRVLTTPRLVLKRYLQLCAENNMTVACPRLRLRTSTCCVATQHRPYQPLVVISPKQLLRLKGCCVLHRGLHRGFVPAGDW